MSNLTGIGTSVGLSGVGALLVFQLEWALPSAQSRFHKRKRVTRLPWNRSDSTIAAFPTLPSQPTMPAGTYVDARDRARTAFTNANLGADQTPRSTSQPRAANGGRTDGLADRRRQAEGLRMPVPQMSLQRVPVTTANAGLAFAGPAGKVAQLQRPRSAMVITSLPSWRNRFG